MLSLSKQQADLAISLLENENRYVVKRNKTRSNDGSAIVEYDKQSDEQEDVIVYVHGRTVTSLHDTGLLEFVGPAHGGGDLFKASSALIANKSILKQERRRHERQATTELINEAANKIGCRVEHDAPRKLYKVVRLDGQKLSNPYIDVAANGVKVTQLKDLTLEEWKREIANAVFNSEIVS
ncbi:hypothetical protein [Pseudoalteromonas sp. Of7M-16]|uniref:hypothetical protein n=1 Tax=Pseudoalteromonas sp. Of7M-16 TaxID=2917756 RepID=UPI001EF6F637|nr:hypothetical protein [Pseudoalteromonas sp. Of7M-16]MCG7550895.1 hypothetical protein [Pseudoalteromonas sp. Of7M-16]